MRLPGSGGANDLASLCWRILVVTNHDRRRFVEKLDFLTTPGYLTGPGAREAAGLPPGTGPYRVITDLAVLGYHEDDQPHGGPQPASRRHAGAGPRGHRLRAGRRARPCRPRAPTAEELRILRDEVDPHRYILGR